MITMLMFTEILASQQKLWLFEKGTIDEEATALDRLKDQNAAVSVSLG